jgi:hypothetical protein
MVRHLDKSESAFEPVGQMRMGVDKRLAVGFLPRLELGQEARGECFNFVERLLPRYIV